MWRLANSARISAPKLAASIAGLGLTVILLIAPLASGATLVLGTRSLTLGASTANAVTNYVISIELTDASSALGSISLTFCSNSPIMSDPCVAPSGFDASSASLSNQSGVTDFSLVTPTSPNQLILTRTASVPANSTLGYTFSGITNPSQADSYYLRVQTYSSTDASGTATNQGGMAFAIVSAVNIQAQVPPFLVFCAGVTIPAYDCSNAQGDYVDFGELSASHVSTGVQQLLAQTNAENGYIVTVVGSTMTSGNNTINEMPADGPSVPGTSQFGLNLAANSSPGIGGNPSGPGTGVTINPNYDQPNQFLFKSGDILASSLSPTDSKKFTISYIVNVPPGQPAGIYATTMTYIATGNF